MKDQCPQIRLIGSYHDNELSEPQRSAIERHLTECPQCAAELEALRQFSQVVVSDPVPSLSPDTLAQLHEHVDQLMDRSVLRFAQALSAIAAAVLVVACASIWNAPSSRREQPVEWERAAVTLRPEAAAEADSMHAAQWMVVELASRR